nr:hypothetical protein [Candidatus Freyrarchaeum guaymaensis]HDO81303.1 hypothetical protein [Candidatus Bathyarchaeota archaeon]
MLWLLDAWLTDLLVSVAALVFLGFMTAFTVNYFVGLRRNRRLMEKYWTLLNEWFKEGFRVVGHKAYRLSGFNVKCKAKREPLDDLDVTLYLVSRENLLHHVVSRFRPHSDMFLCKANFKAKPRLSMEIFNPSKVEAPGEGMLKVDDLDGLEVWASNVDAAKEILERGGLKGEVTRVKDLIVRISVRREKPHLIYSFTPSETKTVTALRLAEEVGKCLKPSRPKPKIAG